MINYNEVYFQIQELGLEGFCCDTRCSFRKSNMEAVAKQVWKNRKFVVFISSRASRFSLATTSVLGLKVKTQMKAVWGERKMFLS